MHILRSTALGTEIIDNMDHEILGYLRDILIDADRAKIVALIIRTYGSPRPYGLLTQDVVSWGNRIHVRAPEVLGELTDFIRLNSYLEQNNRRVIGQRIDTQSGQNLGRCVDVQFRTDTFDLEWIFPRRYFFFGGLALPTSEILEITPLAIIVKNQEPQGEESPVNHKEKTISLDPVISPTTNCVEDEECVP